MSSEYIPYNRREKWNDIQPLPIPSVPICPINYSEEYSDTMSTFRAILAKQEISHRSLALTTHCLYLNASHYTVWQFRRFVLLGLGFHSDQLNDEFQWLKGICRDNPKTYQIWHHRQWLIEHSTADCKENDVLKSLLAEELSDLNELLADDGKNYHLWTFRMFLISHFENLLKSSDMLLNEMKFAENIIVSVDPFNNSAWNYKHWLLTSFSRDSEHLKEFPNQLNFTMQMIKKTPSNECSWNFLTFLLKNLKFSGSPSTQELLSNLFKWCDSELSVEKSKIFFNIFKIENYSELTSIGVNMEEKQRICMWLSEFDGIRRSYWLMKSRE